MRSAEAALVSLEKDDPGTLAGVFIIHGPETYYHSRLIRAIRRRTVEPAFEAFNYTVFEHGGASLDAVRSAVLTPPVMAPHRLVVVRDPEELVGERRGGTTETGGGAGSGQDGQDGEEPGRGGDAAAGSSGGSSRAEAVRRWASFLGEVPPGCRLVLSLSRDLPASSPLLKAGAGLEPPADVIRCFPATARSAEVWVRKLAGELGGSIDPDASQALVMRSGQDLAVLERELEKLITYVGPGNRIRAEDVASAATASAEANVFELVDLVGHRRSHDAVAKLRRLLEQGEPALRLMAMVVRQVRLVFITREMVEGGAEVREIEKRLKLPTWVVRGYLSQARNFDRAQLIEMMRSLAAMDLEVKSGRREPEAALELFILRYGSRLG